MTSERIGIEVPADGTEVTITNDDPTLPEAPKVEVNVDVDSGDEKDDNEEEEKS